MNKAIRTVGSKAFNYLRQGVSLYQRDKDFYIKVEDLDTGATTPIQNATKKLYKDLIKVYTKLDDLIASQQAFAKNFSDRNIPENSDSVDLTNSTD
jgi:hypothetical protein